MKKAVAVLLLAACAVMLLTAAAGAEAKFVTIQEWKDAGGACGDCMLLLL